MFDIHGTKPRLLSRTKYWPLTTDFGEKIPHKSPGGRYLPLFPTPPTPSTSSLLASFVFRLNNSVYRTLTTMLEIEVRCFIYYRFLNSSSGSGLEQRCRYPTGKSAAREIRPSYGRATSTVYTAARSREKLCALEGRSEPITHDSLLSLWQTVYRCLTALGWLQVITSPFVFIGVMELLGSEEKWLSYKGRWGHNQNTDNHITFAEIKSGGLPFHFYPSSTVRP